MVLNVDLNRSGDLSHSLIHTQHTFFSFSVLLLVFWFPSSLSLFIIRETFPTKKKAQSLSHFPSLSRPTFIGALISMNVLVLKVFVRVYVTLIGSSCLLPQLFCSLSPRTRRYPAMSIGRCRRSKTPLVQWEPSKPDVRPSRTERQHVNHIKQGH